MSEGRKDRVLTIRLSDLTYEALVEEAEQSEYDSTAGFVREEILKPYTRGELELGPTGIQILLQMQDQMAESLEHIVQLEEKVQELEEEKDP